MLTEVVQNRISLFKGVFQPLKGEVPLGQKILAPLISWFQEYGRESLVHEPHLYSPLLQTLKKHTSVRDVNSLSQDLFSLAMDYRHHPLLSELAQRLFSLIQESALPNAVQAQHQLNILNGYGTFTDQAVSAFHQASHMENVLPLACAIGVAGLAGRAARVGLSGSLNRLGWAQGFGALTSHGLGGLSKIGVEALVFPVAHNLGDKIVGIRASEASYWKEVGHGFKLMGTLNLASLVNAWGFRVLHGVHLSGAVGRLHALASFNKLAMPLATELSALSLLNAQDAPDRSWAYYLSQSAAMMVQCRLANGFNNALAPNLHHSFQQLDGKAYRLIKQGLERRIGNLRNQAQHFFNQKKLGGSLRFHYAGQALDAALSAPKVHPETSRFSLKDAKDFHVTLAISQKDIVGFHPGEGEIVPAIAPRRPIVNDSTMLLVEGDLIGLEEVSIQPGNPSLNLMIELNQDDYTRIGHFEAETPLGPMASFTMPGVENFWTKTDPYNADAFLFGASGKRIFGGVLDGVSKGERASAEGAEALGNSLKEDLPLRDAFYRAHQAISSGATTAAAFVVEQTPGQDGWYPGEVAYTGDSRFLLLRPSSQGMQVVLHSTPHNLWALPSVKNLNPSNPELAKLLAERTQNLLAHAEAIGLPNQPYHPLVLLNFGETHVLYRNLGVKGGLDPMNNHFERWEPDVIPIQVREGDILMLYSDGLQRGNLGEVISLIQGKNLTEAMDALHRHHVALQIEYMEAYRRLRGREGVDAIEFNDDVAGSDRAFFPIRQDPTYPFYYELKLRLDGKFSLTGSIFMKDGSSFRIVDYFSPDNMTAQLLFMDPQGKFKGIIPGVSMKNPWPTGVETWDAQSEGMPSLYY